MDYLLLPLPVGEGHEILPYLAARKGPEAADRLYPEMVEEAFRRLDPLPVVKRVLFSPPEAQVEVPWGWEAEPQADGPWGHRFATAFHEAFLEGANRVVALDPSSPWLDAHMVIQAMDALSGDLEMVVGPSGSGGIYLLGLRHEVPGLFEGLPEYGKDRIRSLVGRATELSIAPLILPRLPDAGSVPDRKPPRQRSARG